VAAAGDHYDILQYILIISGSEAIDLVDNVGETALIEAADYNN
jgi:hypothetical protein